MQLNIPTYLTIFRIILIPFLILFFYLPFNWNHFVCVFLFIIAALTDCFDGFLARTLHQKTRFGEFLDPVADKLIVITTLILIAQYYNIWWITLPTTTIIIREIIISSLREWMAAIGKRNYISVSNFGKFKTFSQMISLIGLLWRPNIQIELFSVILLYFSAILTFLSMFQYLIVSWIFLKKNK